MIKRFVFLSFLGVFLALSSPCLADEENICDVEVAEEDQDDFYDMYPFCENIDSPLDEGVPYLIVAGILIGVVYTRQRGVVNITIEETV